jgi:serralysin
MAEQTIGVPESHGDWIDWNGDVDTYSVHLDWGFAYDFDALGGGSIDPTLTLYDPSGAQVAFDDDSGVGLDSHIDFTAWQTGDYTLAVADYGNNDTGSYTLETEYNDWLIS